MDNGFIKIWRKIKDWEWSDEPIMFWFFVRLILLANWEDRKWHGILIKRGQFVSSYESLRFKYGTGKRKKRLTFKQVRTLISRLKSTGEVASESTNQYTLYTIVRYRDYQDINFEMSSEMASDRASEGQAKGKQRATTKEDKELKELKEGNNIYVDFEQSTRDKWNLFCNKYPLLSRVEFISESRRKSLKRRYTEPRFKDFEAILAAIEEQPFLINGNKDSPEHKNWRVSFDWLIKNDTNYLKVLERKYKGEWQNDWRSLVFRDR